MGGPSCTLDSSCRPMLSTPPGASLGLVPTSGRVFSGQAPPWTPYNSHAGVGQDGSFVWSSWPVGYLDGPRIGDEAELLQGDEGKNFSRQDNSTSTISFPRNMTPECLYFPNYPSYVQSPPLPTPRQSSDGDSTSVTSQASLTWGTPRSSTAPTTFQDANSDILKAGAL